MEKKFSVDVSGWPFVHVCFPSLAYCSCNLVLNVQAKFAIVSFPWASVRKLIFRPSKTVQVLLEKLQPAGQERVRTRSVCVCVSLEKYFLLWTFQQLQIHKFCGEISKSRGKRGAPISAVCCSALQILRVHGIFMKFAGSRLVCAEFRVITHCWHCAVSWCRIQNFFVVNCWSTSSRWI